MNETVKDVLMTDRRCMERFSLDLPATVLSVTPHVDMPESQLRTVDVSSAGAFVATSSPFPTGTRMLLELRLPVSGKKIHGRVKVKARVVRSVREGMAVCFDDDYQILPSAGNW